MISDSGYSTDTGTEGLINFHNASGRPMVRQDERNSFNHGYTPMQEPINIGLRATYHRDRDKSHRQNKLNEAFDLARIAPKFFSKVRHNACNGPSASSLVEPFQLNLLEYLRDDRYDSVSAHEMARQLARQLINLIFSTADLGYMLVDMKPDNIVVDMSGPDPRVRLIDLDPNYVRDVSMDIDSPASNELRAKQQNIVKPRGDFPELSPKSFTCENLRLVYSAFMLTLLALGLRTVLARWGWDKGTRKFRKADIIRRALYDAIRPIKAPLILYADPEK